MNSIDLRQMPLAWRVARLLGAVRRANMISFQASSANTLNSSMFNWSLLWILVIFCHKAGTKINTLIIAPIDKAIAKVPATAVEVMVLKLKNMRKALQVSLKVENNVQFQLRTWNIYRNILIHKFENYSFSPLLYSQRIQMNERRMIFLFKRAPIYTKMAQKFFTDCVPVGRPWSNF